MTETLLDPEFGHSTEPTKTALNKALGIEGDMWNWLEGPDNRYRLARFSAAMTGLRNMTPEYALLDGLLLLCRSPPDLMDQIHRVWMGKVPSWLTSSRCWRRRWLAVINTCSSPP